MILLAMSNNDLLEVQMQLQKALGESAKLESDFQAAHLKMQPMRDAVHAKQAEVNRLIASFQKLTQAGGPTKTRKKGTYKIEPAKKVDALYRRTITRLTNQGVSEAEAKKKAKSNADALKAKLGLK